MRLPQVMPLADPVACIMRYGGRPIGSFLVIMNDNRHSGRSAGPATMILNTFSIFSQQAIFVFSDDLLGEIREFLEIARITL